MDAPAHHRVNVQTCTQATTKASTVNPSVFARLSRTAYSLPGELRLGEDHNSGDTCTFGEHDWPGLLSFYTVLARNSAVRRLRVSPPPISCTGRNPRSTP